MDLFFTIILDSKHKVEIYEVGVSSVDLKMVDQIV